MSVGGLSPFAFADYDQVMRYLKRKTSGGDFDPEEAVAAANAALGWMEARTARRLRSRTYRTAVSMAATLVADDATVTVADTSLLKVDDELVGVGLNPGSRVASITSGLAFEMDRPAAAAGVGVTLTAGSEPLALDGSGSARQEIGEYPVSAIYSAARLDASGASVALTLTGARLDPGTGLYWLANDLFPRGDRNVLLECRAGYVKPSATERGHFAEFADLTRIQLRAAQVYFSDYFQSSGRSANKSIGSLGVGVADYRMPADIEDAIKLYKRLL